MIFYSDKKIKNFFKNYLKYKQISVYNQKFYIINSLFNNYVANRPLQTFYSDMQFRNKNEKNNFLKKVFNLSKKKKINIIIKSFEKYFDKNFIHIANNPVLRIDKNYNLLKSKFSNNLKKNLNKNYNKAKKYNIQFKFSRNVKDIEYFYNNILTYQYINKFNMFFQPYRIFDYFISTKEYLFIKATIKNKIVAGIFFITENDVIHYNFSSSLNIKKISLNTLLLNESIKHFAKKFKYLDFGSTPLSHKNLLRFKLQWNTLNKKVYMNYTLKPVNHFDFHSDYKILRKLVFNFLPNKVIFLISKYIIPRIFK